jgi:hypothetical protein
MKTIEDYYRDKIREDKDIQEHLPTLKRYAEKCKHVTEMGVRSIVSTWALLYANPKKLISIDIKHPSEFINYDSSGCNIEEVERLSKANGIDFSFVIGDTLKIDIAPTDLLFIDTLHTYNQLRQELARHASKVSKYIILHDTETFRNKDEIFSGSSAETQTKKGIWAAVEEFLSENKNWKIYEHFTNNNGLTVLGNVPNLNKSDFWGQRKFWTKKRLRAFVNSLRS